MTPPLSTWMTFNHPCFIFEVHLPLAAHLTKAVQPSVLITRTTEKKTVHNISDARNGKRTNFCRSLRTTAAAVLIPADKKTNLAKLLMHKLLNCSSALSRSSIKYAPWGKYALNSQQTSALITMLLIIAIHSHLVSIQLQTLAILDTSSFIKNVFLSVERPQGKISIHQT